MLWHKAQGAGGVGGGENFTAEVGNLYSSGNASVTSAAIAYPADIATGDVLVIIGQNDGAVGPTGFSATGFAEVPETVFGPLLTKTATGSESGSVTLNAPGSGRITAIMFRVRSLLAGTPLCEGRGGSFVSSDVDYTFALTDPGDFPGTGDDTTPTFSSVCHVAIGAFNYFSTSQGPMTIDLGEKLLEDTQNTYKLAAFFIDTSALGAEGDAASISNASPGGFLGRYATIYVP